MNNTTAMEEIAKCWGLWGPRRSSSGGEPSWEEQAFARDSAGHLGGCVWPPRSYSCSFCQREFRSAQALGGHMNVHRRDRARLRQCSSSDGDVQDAPHDEQPQHQDAFLHSKLHNPSTTCSTPSSYLSTIIKESQNKVVMSKLMAREAIDHDQEEEEEQVRRMKRRRLDHDHPVVAIPLFAAACDREELLAGVGRDIAKVPKIIASPSSSLLLVGQQEVDLELRLGSGN